VPRVRMIAFLVILGGAVFGVLGGLHAIYTLLDLRNPRRLVPCRSFGCTRDGEFGSQAVGWTHGHVAGLDWL
jgi:hypothetical protein